MTHAVSRRPQQSRRLPGLDGLRAISIAAVIVYHLNPAWLPGGFLGVDLFFVISGFLITQLLINQARRQRGVGRRLRDFYGRRARRILPATVLLVAVLVVTATFSAGLVKIETGDALAGLGFATNWWQISQGRDYFATWAGPSSLQHLWSLAIEEQFYLVWPALLTLIIFVTRRRWKATFITLGVVAGLGALASAGWMFYLAATLDIPHATGASRLYYGTDTHASGILVGAAAAALFGLVGIRRVARHRREPLPPTVLVRVAVELVGLAAIGGLVVLGLRLRETDPWLYRGGFLLVAVVGMVAVACASRPWSILGRVLDVQPLRWIGLVSFELYLWHWPVGLVWHALQPAPPWPWLMVEVAVMVALAGATHHWVTVPIWHPRPGVRVAPRVAPMAVLTAMVVLFAVAVPTALSGPSRPTIGSLARVVALPPPPPEPTALGPDALQWKINTYGDSVMQGATLSMKSLMPNADVHAIYSTPCSPIVGVDRSVHQWVNQDVADGSIGEIVVIHCAHNDPDELVNEADIEQMLDELDGRLLVVLLTIKLPWPESQRIRNDALRTAAAGHPNVLVADWEAYGSSHPEWFGSDGTHMTSAGNAAYAQFIAATIMGYEVIPAS